MKIELKNVTKIIKRNKVLDDINYTFEGGHIYGLNGKNGCGKTMLMRCITGLIYPTDGEVVINGKRLGRDIQFPPSVGILIENPTFLPNYTGLDNLIMLAELKGNCSVEDIKNIIREVGLNPDDKRKYYKYSLGMRQRLGVAAALMNKSDIIILDEPINAIDGEGDTMIRNLIKSYVDENRIIIVACHDMQEMDLLADIKIYMADGKIVGDENVSS